MMEDLRQPGLVKNDKITAVRLTLGKPRAPLFHAVNVEKRLGQRSGNRKVKDCGYSGMAPLHFLGTGNYFTLGKYSFNLLLIIIILIDLFSEDLKLMIWLIEGALGFSVLRF